MRETDREMALSCQAIAIHSTLPFYGGTVIERKSISLFSFFFPSSAARCAARWTKVQKVLYAAAMHIIPELLLFYWYARMRRLIWCTQATPPSGPPVFVCVSRTAQSSSHTHAADVMSLSLHSAVICLLHSNEVLIFRFFCFGKRSGSSRDRKKKKNGHDLLVAVHQNWRFHLPTTGYVPQVRLQYASTALVLHGGNCCCRSRKLQDTGIVYATYPPGPFVCLRSDYSRVSKKGEGYYAEMGAVQLLLLLQPLLVICATAAVRITTTTNFCDTTAAAVPPGISRSGLDYTIISFDVATLSFVVSFCIGASDPNVLNE